MKKTPKQTIQIQTDNVNGYWQPVDEADAQDARLGRTGDAGKYPSYANGKVIRAPKNPLESYDR